MCPALILAASRKDKVIGRTIILTVSTRIKKGFSQSGAPLGRIPAVNLEIEFCADEKIRLNHRGSAIERVINK
jgi:hypothetical protein